MADAPVVVSDSFVLLPRGETEDAHSVIYEASRLRDLLAAVVKHAGGEVILEYEQVGESALVEVFYEPIPGRGLRLRADSRRTDPRHIHDKGRDCERTDEVLENYRRRALAAERRVAELEKELPS